MTARQALSEHRYTPRGEMLMRVMRGVAYAALLALGLYLSFGLTVMR